MDEKISKLFLPILDKLYNTEPAGEPFRKPVDVVKYGCYDYYYYVRHPIDLSTIKTRLTSHQYKDAWRFIADIQLMFANAYLFNKKGTPVYEFTNKLNKIWISELTPIMQRLNYCCGTLHKFGPQLLFCHGTTPENYCQIKIGDKYKCYQDQYSFCMLCFNKIESNFINIQNLSCETSRMKLPTQPVKKSDFIDCTNDNWQYESFIQCTQCCRRVHQICELHPAEESEIEKCTQHAQLEIEQKMLCQVPEEFRNFEEQQPQQQESNDSSLTIKEEDEEGGGEENVSPNKITTKKGEEENFDGSETTELQLKAAVDDELKKQQQQQQQLGQIAQLKESCAETTTANSETHASSTSLDDELLQYARDVDDLTNSAPPSPEPENENRSRLDSAKDNCQRKLLHYNDNVASSSTGGIMNLVPNSRFNPSAKVSSNNNTQSSNAKNSVDKIAARLSISKKGAEAHSADENLNNKQAAIAGVNTLSRDKFVCNHCYRKKRIGFDLRHRKYSARRLPHTRMSRYIETKVNEHIRENSPSAGEVTIRVLTAYRDTISVKPEMKEYVRRCGEKDPSRHSNLEGYPDEFGYTNRAIFAWQEIDGVDVCVFGMHVQEYGEDCPEPNRQVIYLSYLDSVHFFRPKQVRTAVYHEILLSYFKYVKKLGFRRVFIWVCPSRKGDDYIFYRHPTEQKMPTLKRLLDWYVNLLDKGIMAGIVEKHQNIYQYAETENWNSILSIPYLSGDYWPGEFERLLKIMIESQKEYESKMMQVVDSSHEEVDLARPAQDISELSEFNRNNHNTINNNNISKINHSNFNNSHAFADHERHNMISLTSIYQKIPPRPSNVRASNMKNSVLNHGLRASNGLPPPPPSIHPSMSFIRDGDFGRTQNNNFRTFSPEHSRSDSEQPLDLSKSSSNTSPESYYDDDETSELSFKSTTNNRKKRRKSNSMGYTKKRTRVSSQNPNVRGGRCNQASTSFDCRYSHSQPVKSRPKTSTQSSKSDHHGSEYLLDPEEELIKNLERSLKRQREGFIVARLSDCDCSPHFESQRRKEEATFTCELMKGREPFLQLARLKNYEFSTLRRAKFSSLAMVKHLGQTFKLDPICNECFSLDSSKRHYACSHCPDYYLCTSCHENTHHDHIMSLVTPITLPDIDEFLQQCSTTNSISSASSTISNKSSNDSTLELSSQSATPTLKRHVTGTSTPLNRHSSNTFSSAPNNTMPLSCQRQKNRDLDLDCRAEDEENANICSFGTTTKLSLPNLPSPPPSHTASNTRGSGNVQVELDQVLVENFIRQAEISFDIDFDQMKTESKKLLAHYWACPIKDTCPRCKFVVLSCSFMGVLMRSTRLQMMMTNCNPSEILPSNNSNNNHTSGINLTTAHQFSYQPKDK